MLKIDGITIYTTQLGEKFRIVQHDVHQYVIEKEISYVKKRWFLKDSIKYKWAFIEYLSIFDGNEYDIDSIDHEKCGGEYYGEYSESALVFSSIKDCEEFIDHYDNYSFDNHNRQEELKAYQNLKKERRLKQFPIYH